MLSRFLAWIRSLRRRPKANAFAEVDRIRGVRPLDEDDERERRAEVNAATARRRSEAAAVFGALLSGRTGWLGSTRGWLKGERKP